MTWGWEKDLAESTQMSETSSGDLSCISFGDSLGFYQKAEQLGNTGRNSPEKHKMRNTHRLQLKARFTFGDVVKHQLGNIFPYHFNITLFHTRRCEYATKKFSCLLLLNLLLTLCISALFSLLSSHSHRKNIFVFTRRDYTNLLHPVIR